MANITILATQEQLPAGSRWLQCSFYADPAGNLIMVPENGFPDFIISTTGGGGSYTPPAAIKVDINTGDNMPFSYTYDGSIGTDPIPAVWYRNGSTLTLASNVQINVLNNVYTVVAPSDDLGRFIDNYRFILYPR